MRYDCISYKVQGESIHLKHSWSSLDRYGRLEIVFDLMKFLQVHSLYLGQGLDSSLNAAVNTPRFSICSYLDRLDGTPLNSKNLEKTDLLQYIESGTNLPRILNYCNIPTSVWFSKPDLKVEANYKTTNQTQKPCVVLSYSLGRDPINHHVCRS